MKLEKYTLGKSTVTVSNAMDWEGETGVHTLAYRHISAVSLREVFGETCLTIHVGHAHVSFAATDEAGRLRELAAELHQRMEACE